MIKTIVFIGLMWILLAFQKDNQTGVISIENKTSSSGNHYKIIYKNSCKIDFVVGSKPNKEDQDILLCIAGAFTDLNTDKVDGIYVVQGKRGNENKKNTSLGGAMKILKGECEIFPTNKGSKLDDTFINKLCLQKASLFQQIQMIENGVAAKFKDIKLFQRRGIAVFKNGKIAVVESDEAITLKTFADDLVSFNVKNLLYTDMGAWDEGWYRNPLNGLPVMLGKDLSQTKRQSNWVVFRAK